MSVRISHFFEPSSFYQSHSFSSGWNKLRSTAGPSISSSIAFQRSSHFTDDVLSRFDRIDVLGGEDRYGNIIGHAGCVNALAWSQSGHCLATGSDDRKVVLWKLGSSDMHPRTIESDHSEEFGKGRPTLDIAQSDVIETGHRANIFNIKWAPNSGDRRLFTCAGDCQIRVFDLTRASSFADRQVPGTGKEYKIWLEGQGACTRVLRCHSSRAKKISTENSPDVFLTVAEDGEVRQTDLRVPHTCSRSQHYGQGCPRPLVEFRMELYSLSVSKSEPWLFAVAGTSDKVYLLDRRMIPRLLRSEWGSHIDEGTAALTHCVRRFSREPDEEIGSNETHLNRRRYGGAHVTAVKISEANGRDVSERAGKSFSLLLGLSRPENPILQLLASYSADAVYRFDMMAAPGRLKRADVTMLPNSSKRRKTSPRSLAPQRSGERPRQIIWEQKVKRTVVQVLFQRSGSSHILSKTYSRLEQDLDKLDASNAASHGKSSMEYVKERSVSVLCKVLLYIQKATQGATESVDLQLEPYRAELQKWLTDEAKELLGSLIDELDEANKWQAYSEEVKVRVLLWDRAEEYIKSSWAKETEDKLVSESAAQLQEEQEVSEVEMNESESLQDVENDGVVPASFRRRFQAILDDEHTDGEDDDERTEEERRLDDGIVQFAADADLLMSEDSNEDTDDETDGSEGGGDDSDQRSSFALPSDTADSSNDHPDGRHGVSGENAPIVYPNGCFKGHANNETVKDCGFLGSNDEYIWSGSDCGHFFVWSNDERQELKGIWKGDGSVVNVLTQHPTLPIAAVSGIDDTVKIFGPVSLGVRRIADATDRKEEIMRHNSRDRVGFNSRNILRLLARHVQASQGTAPQGRSPLVEGEDAEDCIVM